MWSKAWVCGPLLVGNACLNTVKGMDVACYCSVFSGKDCSDWLMCAVEPGTMLNSGHDQPLADTCFAAVVGLVLCLSI